MRRRSSIAAGVFVALTAPLVLAQAPAPSARPAAVPAPTTTTQATGVIVGQVVDGTTGQPLPEAIVTLNGGRAGGAPAMPTVPAGNPQAAATAAALVAATTAGRAPAAPPRVMTGSDGRFLFHDLAAGTFQLSASLTGYTAALTPGLATLITGAAGSTPTPINVTEGEVVTNVRLRLWKTAVVSGTVLDDGGEPAIGLTVQVARRAMVAGRARYIPGSSARTDDRGVYRITGLIPGDYLVVVPQTQASVPTAIMSGLVESLTGTGRAGAGGGLALLDLMSSGVAPGPALGGGLRVGDFMVSSTGSVPITGPDGRLQAYQTLFFPDAGAPTQASTLSLKSGEERTGLDFRLRLIPTSRVSGTATGPEGPIANLGIRLIVPADGSGSDSEFDVATTITTANGTFAFNGVPPGQFLLRAQKQPRPAITPEMLNNPLAEMIFGGAAAPASTDALFAASTVTVGNRDVDGVTLHLTPGPHAIGRVEFENASGRAAPAGSQLQAITVTLTPVEGPPLTTTGGLATGMATPDRLTTDGQFRTRGYQPGQYFVSVSNSGAWQVKAATANGRDILDTPLDLRDGDVNGIVITLADTFARVSGTVTSPGETDLSETTVFVFPADTRTWIENGMNARRFRTTRAGRTGTYAIANMPAGEYLAAAIDRADEGDSQDPAFIERLSRVATRVVITGATPRTVDLVKAQVSR